MHFSQFLQKINENLRKFSQKISANCVFRPNAQKLTTVLNCENTMLKQCILAFFLLKLLKIFESFLKIFSIFCEHFLNIFWKFFENFLKTFMNFLKIFCKSVSPRKKILATPMIPTKNESDYPSNLKED